HGELLELREHEHFAFLVVERTQELLDEQSFLGALELLERGRKTGRKALFIAVGTGQRVELLVLSPKPPAMVACDPGDDAKQETSHRHARIVFSHFPVQDEK